MQYELDKINYFGKPDGKRAACILDQMNPLSHLLKFNSRITVFAVGIKHHDIARSTTK